LFDNFLARRFLDLDYLGWQQVNSLGHLLYGKQGMHEEGLNFINFLFSLRICRGWDSLYWGL